MTTLAALVSVFLIAYAMGMFAGWIAFKPAKPTPLSYAKRQKRREHGQITLMRWQQAHPMPRVGPEPARPATIPR